MGTSKSTLIRNNVDLQNTLLEHINSTAIELSEYYTTNFLNPDFCNSIALIYNDKLLNFRKQELDDVAYSLGVLSDTPLVKQKVCEKIIKHYTDRLNLIAKIQKSVSFCANRIMALVSGPICSGNPHIFDMEECQNKGGQWQPAVALPDLEVDQNLDWYTNVSNMQRQYISNLSRLSQILSQLKNYESEIQDEQLQQMRQEVDQLIETMHSTCGNIYDKVLNTKTYTKQESENLKQVKQKALQQTEATSAAMQAAAHQSFGIPHK